MSCRDATMHDAAAIGRRDSDANPSIGEVIAINIHPVFWRQGLGRELFLESVSRLGKPGFTQATLWVVRDNQRARSFYETLGWRLDGGERTRSELTGSPLPEVRYRVSL